MSTSVPTSPPPHGTRLRANHSSLASTRDSIISSSAKGWSPLQINKRESGSLRSSFATDPGMQARPRRTSNSFKVVAGGSLVSKSPFKSSQPQCASGDREVIHERRGTRQLGEAAVSARGVGSTPKATIGLGIPASTEPLGRISSRSLSGNTGAAINGQRKVSSDRRIQFQSISGERRSSGERRVLASKENESPAVSFKKSPRPSIGLKGLAEGSYVSKSPFKKPSEDFTSMMQCDETPSPVRRRIPVEKDDVFSSPSPSQTSGGKRRTSGTVVGITSQSPTPSPRAFPTSVSQTFLVAANATTPLRPQLPSSITSDSLEPTPTPTPHKSAMTPSRRLRGPRVAGDIMDSPSKKTVTFQSVPDVKEYEIMSAEPSVDGSYSYSNDGDFEGEEGEWEDEARIGSLNSLDEILAETPSESTHEPHLAPGVESTTADFMDTLVEEGLFSPPEMDTPAFQDSAVFELPMETSLTEGMQESDERSYLATPDQKINTNDGRVVEDILFGQADEVGVLYGRTHHAQRAAEAHVHKKSDSLQAKQPNIPRNEEHNTLYSANSLQPFLPSLTPTSPSFPHAYNDPFAVPAIPLTNNAHPHAQPTEHLPGSFITIQTAVKALSADPELIGERKEDGPPSGRTSRKEKVLAARTLAMGNLGLGVPGRPNRSAVSLSTSYETSSSQGEQESEAEPEKDKEPLRKLPKMSSTSSAEDDLTSSTDNSTAVEDMEQVKDTQQNALGVTFLSQIGSSPFAVSAPMFEEPPESRSSSSSSTTSQAQETEQESDRPLTPPPILSGNHEKQDSPHRLPDFNFELENIEFEDLENGEKTKGILKNNSITPLRVTSIEKENDKPISQVLGVIQQEAKHEKEVRKFVSEPLNATKQPAPPLPSSFVKVNSEISPADFTVSPHSQKNAQDSSTNRIRQRISREMIRETIQQRIADGSLSRRPRSMDLDGLSASFSTVSLREQFEKKRQEGKASSLDKVLPPPPAESPVLGSAPATPIKSRSKSNMNTPRSCERPSMRPRSQTQSAHEVFKQSEKEGGEVKSALDKIACLVRREAKDKDAKDTREECVRIQREDSGTIADVMPPAPNVDKEKPTGILRNPKGLFDSDKESSIGKSNNVRPASAMSSTSSVSGSSNDGPLVREQAIIARRRQEKQRQASAMSAMSNGSRRSRRSLSTGDVGEEANKAKAFRQKMLGPQPSKLTGPFDQADSASCAAKNGLRGGRLTLGIDDDERSILDSFRQEVANVGSERGYKIRERPVVRASYADKMSQSNAGDLETGKAWKALRRPSDIHEHAAAIKEMRTREIDPSKAAGTIFVKVLGIEGLQVPIPEQQTFFCVTLDNGIDYIKTPYSVLGEGVKVGQEFSLVEHPNFEFSLSIDVRRDPHILKLVHERNTPVPTFRPIAPVLPAKSHHSHFRSLFGSPRKPKGPLSRDREKERSSTPLPPVAPKRDTIANYFPDANSSTLAKTHIQFKTIAKNCDARVLEIRYPMFAMFKGDLNAPSKEGEGQRKALAKITLQVFRLPPIPGLTGEELPQCIDECLRGLRHHMWHEHEYHDGVLTQDGGDCTHPKRRIFKVVGGNLIAINEVTKKQVAKIDLRQAVSVIDLNLEQGSGSPKSRMTLRPREDEGFGVRPKSFLLEFRDGEGITFMADTNAAKEAWMETLQGLIGKIPSNPLWAELLTLRMREKATKRTVSSGSQGKERRMSRNKLNGSGTRTR
ncbi:hypothetical protein L204_104464 [Cryptococcus depauperatus]